MSKSDGSTADYYELPNGGQLQDLIGHRDMNAQIGEIFRECYRYGIADHCDKLRGAKKIAFYAAAEVKRLEALQGSAEPSHASFEIDTTAAVRELMLAAYRDAELSISFEEWCIALGVVAE